MFTELSAFAYVCKTLLCSPSSGFLSIYLSMFGVVDKRREEKRKRGATRCSFMSFCSFCSFFLPSSFSFFFLLLSSSSSFFFMRSFTSVDAFLYEVEHGLSELGVLCLLVVHLRRHTQHETLLSQRKNHRLCVCVCADVVMYVCVERRRRRREREQERKERKKEERKKEKEMLYLFMFIYFYLFFFITSNLYLSQRRS